MPTGKHTEREYKTDNLSIMLITNLYGWTETTGDTGSKCQYYTKGLKGFTSLLFRTML